MKKIIIILNLIFIWHYSFAQKEVNTLSVQFVPKIFHNIKLDYGDNTIHSLTPCYPDPIFKMKNKIAITIPQKIIFSPKQNNFKPIIPVCGYYCVSDLRELKYRNQSALFIHIKKNKNEESYHGEVKEEEIYYPWENVIIPEYSSKRALRKYDRGQRKNQRKIRRAQKLTDEELNTGSFFGDALNINALKYVDIPLESGTYEIYLTIYGLESNHAKVEIVFEK